MKKIPPTDLNDYHQARNKRMVRKVSEQRLLSPEECSEQIKRLAEQSRQAQNVGGHKVLTSASRKH